MSDVITTLHRKDDPSVNIYPNVKAENIPSEIMRIADLGTYVNQLTSINITGDIDAVGMKADVGTFDTADVGTLNVSGVSTFEGTATFGSDVEVDGNVTLNSPESVKFKTGSLDFSDITSFMDRYYGDVAARKFEGRNEITLTGPIRSSKGDPDTTATGNDYELPDPVDDTESSKVKNWKYCWYDCTLVYYLSDTQTHDLYTPVFGNCSAWSFCKVTWGSAENPTYRGNWSGRLYLRATGNVGNYRLFAECSATYIGPSKVTGEFTGGFSWNNSYNEMFANCSNLTEIGAFDFSGCPSMENCFGACHNLKSIHITHFQVSFSISASTQFEEADLVEIIGNLDAVSTAQTLTMGSTNLAKLTEDEILVATGKGWTLA